MTFEWEIIENMDGDRTLRAQVFGGWIVLTYVNENEAPGTHSTVFVPDPGHKWKVTKER